MAVELNTGYSAWYNEIGLFDGFTKLKITFERKRMRQPCSCLKGEILILKTKDMTAQAV